MERMEKLAEYLTKTNTEGATLEDMLAIQERLEEIEKEKANKRKASKENKNGKLTMPEYKQLIRDTYKNEADSELHIGIAESIDDMIHGKLPMPRVALELWEDDFLNEFAYDMQGLK